MEAFSIFDPAGLLGRDAIAEEKLEILLDHYSDLGVDKASCVREYREFTSFVKSHTKFKTCKSLQELDKNY